MEAITTLDIFIGVPVGTFDSTLILDFARVKIGIIGLDGFVEDHETIFATVDNRKFLDVILRLFGFDNGDRFRFLDDLG